MGDADIDFAENGIHCHAGKALARADKDGRELWRATGVSVTAPPTKELVLELDGFFTRRFDGAFSEESDQEVRF